MLKYLKLRSTLLNHLRILTLQVLENSIREKIGLNVLIKNKKNNSGSLLLEYKDLDQLNKIIEIIKSNY